MKLILFVFVMFIIVISSMSVLVITETRRNNNAPCSEFAGSLTGQLPSRCLREYAR